MAKDIKKNLPLSEEVINVLTDIGKEGIESVFRRTSDAAYSHLFNLNQRRIRSSNVFQRVSSDVASNLTKKYNSTRRSIREDDMDKDMFNRTMKKRDKLKEATVICNQLTAPIDINVEGKKTKDIKQLPLTMNNIEGKDETIYVEYSTIGSLINAIEQSQRSPQGKSGLGKIIYVAIYLAIEDISDGTINSFEKNLTQLAKELAENSDRINLDRIPKLNNKGNTIEILRDLLPVSKGRLINRVREELRGANYLINKRNKYSKNIKLSRLLSRIFPETSGDVMDLIVNEFLDTVSHQNPDDKLDEIFDIVEGKDIQYYYNSYNNSYVDLLPTDKTPNANKEEELAKGASLYGSCMRHKKDYATTDLYARNPDKIKLLVLKSKYPGKIVGRALLWYPGDGNVYVDRIYTISERCEKLFRKYIIQKGFIGIHNSSSTDENARERTTFILNDLEIGKSFSEFPYLDSLMRLARYVDYNGNIREAIGFRPTRMEDKIRTLAKDLLTSDKVIKLNFNSLPLDFSLASSVAQESKELKSKFDEKVASKNTIDKYYKFNRYFNSRNNVRAGRTLHYIDNISVNNSHRIEFNNQKHKLLEIGKTNKYGTPKNTSRMVGVELDSIYHVMTDRRLYHKLLMQDFKYEIDKFDGKWVCIVHKNDIYKLFGKKNIKKKQDPPRTSLTLYTFTRKNNNKPVKQEKKKSNKEKPKEEKWISYEDLKAATDGSGLYDQIRTRRQGPRVYYQGQEADMGLFQAAEQQNAQF